LELAYQRADYVVIVTRDGTILGGRAFPRARFDGVASLRRTIHSGRIPDFLGQRDGQVTTVKEVVR
jgi:hypothetical protein